MNINMKIDIYRPPLLRGFERYGPENRLETAIGLVQQALEVAPDESNQRICLTALTGLIKERSPEAIKAMEAMKWPL